MYKLVAEALIPGIRQGSFFSQICTTWHEARETSQLIMMHLLRHTLYNLEVLTHP